MALSRRLKNQRKKCFVGLCATIALILLLLLQTNFADMHHLLHKLMREYFKFSMTPQLTTVPGRSNEFSDDTFGPVHFHISGSDVIVLLHMQKTGGSQFNLHLVENLKLKTQCRHYKQPNRNRCPRPNNFREMWLFSRDSLGWYCGVHADWTGLHECVDGKLDEVERKARKRRYFYVTMVRNPLDRYISEYLHVRRGATWRNTSYSCNFQSNKIYSCYEGASWGNVSLESFMSCPTNMAVNRQTRMLADLRLVNCYERWTDRDLSPSRVTEIDNILLRSAMKNLQDVRLYDFAKRLFTSRHQKYMQGHAKHIP